jgi:hypothetical protein
MPTVEVLADDLPVHPVQMNHRSTCIGGDGRNERGFVSVEPPVEKPPPVKAPPGGPPPVEPPPDEEPPVEEPPPVDDPPVKEPPAEELPPVEPLSGRH